MQNRVMVIAEAGVNHNGSLDMAKELVDAAVSAGADAVKFQTFKADALVCSSAHKAEYQKSSTDSSESQYQMLRKLELEEAAFCDLFPYCRQKDILFLSSPFDSESIAFLDQLGVQMFKIPSGEITNLPYLEKIGALHKPIILSTGMATGEEVQAALDILLQAGTSLSDVTLLHCTTSYPVPFAEVNLRAMLSLAERFYTAVGYSDHTRGIEVAIAAAALGAAVIEKHVTLDKTLGGPDHRASIEPDELAAMVRAVRNIEKALGNGEKIPTASDLQNKDVVRKSIVAARDIDAGELFTEKNLGTKRPGTGLSPMLWYEVLGTRAHIFFKKDDQVTLP